MKRAVMFVIILAFFLSAVPAFAAEKTLFQIAGDSIDEAAAKTKPITMKPEKVDTFQNMSNYIAQGAANAKPLTLRGNDQELARRKGMK